MEQKTTTEKKFSKFATTTLMVLVLVLLATGIYTAMQLKNLGKTEKQEQILLPEIDLYKIVPSNCNECFSIDIVEKFVQESSNAKIINTKIFKTNTQEAKDFIKKYNLSRLPAVILLGEVNKLNIQNFEKVDDALVFDDSPPVYFEVATGKIKGKTAATVIYDSECEDCLDLQILVSQLKQLGVYLTNKTVNYRTTEGKNLVAQYKIKKLPSLLLSKDALEYAQIKNVWAQVGTQETDGTLVMRMINPPYFDVPAGQIQQIPYVVYLSDKSCAKCYNVSLHKNLLENNFGMKFSEEKFVDVSSKEGAKLVSKYKITKVPTVIISSEAGAYNNFKELWKTVGVGSNDGSFVFTKLDLLEGMSYKDLKTKTVVTVEPKTAK